LARNQTQTKEIFESKIVDRLNSFLRGVVTEGTAKHMSDWGYTEEAYGKTGTTSFYRDAWFAGFSKELVAVSWVGFDSLSVEESNVRPPAKLTGGGVAMPIWAKFFKASFPSSEPKTEE